MTPPQKAILPVNQAQPQTMQAQAAAAQAQPQYGLSGAEQAFQAGMQGGVSALGQGQQSALSTLGLGNNIAQQSLQQGLAGAQGQLQQGVNALGGNFGASAVNVNQNTGQPLFQQAAAGVGQYSPAGLQAQGLQSALSGAQGQEAFNQAIINNPFLDYLNNRGQEALANQAAASGGLGSGQFQAELQELGQAQAGSQLQNQINNLGNLSNQGLQAAGQQGQFLSQAGQQMGNLASTNAQLGTQANIASANNALNAAQGAANLFGQGAGYSQQAGLQGSNIASSLAGQGAGIQSNTSQNVAQLLSGTGNNIGQARFQTGRDLATQIGQSTSALSNLANQRGTGFSDILGSNSTNLANIISGSGQLDSNQQIQLAQLLSNLSVGEGFQITGAQNAIGQAQAGGILGRADAIGGTATDIAQMYAMSDKRLKNNIEKILTVNGVNFYKWKWNGKLGLKGGAIGVLAQEVEKLIPESVIDTVSGFKAVNYKMVGDHINASI
jgi:hypothetical protein